MRTYIAPLLALAFLLMSGLARAQTEEAYPYRDRSTGYHQPYEVKPGRGDPFIDQRARREIARSGSPSTQGRFSSLFMADAHYDLKGYDPGRCVACHPRQAADNMHVVRNGVTCRQCHGSDPIASISHYFSRMNPIRRHAYVCASCHQGASASFATYVVHEPKPFTEEAEFTFPALYWAFWIMVAIFAMTFVVFLPHTVLWVIRECFALLGKNKEAPS